MIVCKDTLPVISLGLGFIFYFTQTQRRHRHTLNCLVHRRGFLLQSKLKPLCFSLSSVYVNLMFFMSFWVEYCATWRCKASCIYDLQSISACRYVVKLYCESVNTDGFCFLIFWVDFFNTACIVEIKQYSTEICLCVTSCSRCRTFPDLVL